jgi:hypothetical protein
MSKLLTRTRLIQVVVLGVITAGATAMVAAGIPADDGLIYGCYSNATGQLRLIDPAEECRESETLVYWNQIGQTGPEGPAGPEGPTGPTGPSGSSGDVYSIDRSLGEFSHTLFTGWSTIARFDLQAGRYAVIANVRLDNQTSFGTDASCGVLVGSRAFDATDTVWGGATTSQSMSGVAPLSGPGSVELRCRADSPEAITLRSFSFTVMTIGPGGATSSSGSTSSTAGGTTTGGSNTTGTGTTSAATTGTTTGTTGTTTGTTGTTTGTTGTTGSTTGTTGTTTGSTGTTTGTTGTTTGTTGVATTGTTTGTSSTGGTTGG